jgi:CDP-diacylglycerol--glycerol-3-phosphate 3-phosphatidyltransferase
MRGLYGAVKAATFAWALLVQPWPQLDPAGWAAWSATAQAVTMALVIASVTLCLLRGLPVVLEFLIDQKVLSRPRLTWGA